jgi:hypothetical protein
MHQALDWAAKKLLAAARRSMVLLFVATLSFIKGGVANGDVILSWNTFGNLGTETTEGSVANLGVAAADLTLGVGVISDANGNRFGGRAWFDAGDSAAGTTLAESITGNDFFQFIMTPNANTSINLTSFDFRWDRSGTGPDSVALRSSLDGFAADLGQVTGMVSGGAATTTDRTINLALNNITTGVTFRLYGFNATNSTGTGGFDTNANAPNVILNGSITAVPEPSSVAMLGLIVMGTTWFRRSR